MTTKANIRDKVIGTRILAAGISQSLTGVRMTSRDLEIVDQYLDEARESIKRALEHACYLEMNQRHES